MGIVVTPPGEEREVYPSNHPTNTQVGTITVIDNGGTPEVRPVWDLQLESGVQIGTIDVYPGPVSRPVWFQGGFSEDPDATTYLDAVEAADGAPLPQAWRVAVSNFVAGCKADGIWDAIKASCIMCGARTLAGALVPLVGAAPTNNNFVSGDYNRVTGLKADGATKYLDTNLDSSDITSNDWHMCAYITEGSSSGVSIMGIGGAEIGACQLYSLSSGRGQNATGQTLGTADLGTLGLLGISRGSSANFWGIAAGSDTAEQQIQASQPVLAGCNITVFTRSSGGNDLALPGNAKLTFYSFGTDFGQAGLEGLSARLNTLMSSISSALP